MYDRFMLVEAHNRNNFGQTKYTYLAPTSHVQVEVNGVDQGDVPPGMILSVEVTDGVDPVTPDSVSLVGDTLSIAVPPNTGDWVRPSEWLPLPTITASDNRLVALFLVFENEYNVITVQATSGAADIDFGDGTTTTSTGAVIDHVYDYATISGTVNQYYDGRNYKQVILDISYSGVGTLSQVLIDRNATTGLNSLGVINIADLALSLPSCTSLGWTSQRRATMLEQVKFINHGNIPIQFTYANSLRSVQFYPSGTTSILSSAAGTGIRKIESLTFNSATTLSNAFLNWKDLIIINGLTSSSATSLQQLTQGCEKLISAKGIDVPNNTTLLNAFNSNYCLREVEVLNCGSVVTTTNMFTNTASLQSVILSGITVGFSVQNHNLDAASIDAMFTALGTAAGAQTVTVTGNPGASTCDTTIATAKGWTVLT